MKNFQADTMQEALAKVKDEMGPDAVILKSRRATRKVSGKNQPCFEVTAALEESLFAKPERPPVAAPASPSAPAGPRQPAQRAADPSLLRARGKDAAAPGPRPVNPTAVKAALARPATLGGRIPPADGASGQYDWKGSLRRVSEDGRNMDDTSEAAEAAGAENSRQAPLAPPTGSLMELLRSELRDMKERVEMPTREIKVLKQEIKAMIEAAAPVPQRRASDLPAEGKALQAHLLDLDIDAEYAAELARMATSTPPEASAGTAIPAGPVEAATAGEIGAGVFQLLAEKMSRSIRTTGGIRMRPGRPTVVALVGPTGVGKTTTLAKLAALAKLQSKRVGIVSADNFRMGANEQLELFGRTAGIPVRPAFSPAEAGEALRRFADRDLILVDTAGRSPAHPDSWTELQTLLRALRPDEVHLVLSATTRLREMKHQYALYSRLNLDRAAGCLIFTKLDECLSLGCLYNMARRMQIPLSYLCNGQTIPDHILLAEPRETARAVLYTGRDQLIGQSG